MYKISLLDGCVLNLNNNKIVSPCQSTEDVDYVEYINWLNQGNIPEEVDFINQESLQNNEIEINKEIKRQMINNIIVTTSNGNVFQGNEESQDRMSRSIISLSILGQDYIDWILYDNSVVSISLEELKEALVLANQEQLRILFL